jgi:tRNA nucleotidyltransferase (CCA-adding enzyme)
VRLSRSPDPSGALRRLRRLPIARPLLDVVRPDEGAWLVGGAVRDLLLGIEPQELDVVVVGEIEDLAARLGRAVARHVRFGSIEVEARPGVRYDLVRARTERYPAPGALPEVAPAARIEDDLPRRDVSVNAIALRIPDGRIAAVDGALEDLRGRTLRVLHDRSLVDDPTRAWRIARYAARLGFGVEARTRELLAAADPATISGARHGHELRLALAEPDPRAALAALQELAPRFLPAGFRARPDGVEDAWRLLPRGGRRDLVLLARCCAAVSLPDLLPWLERLELTSAEREIVAAGSRNSTLEPLRRATRPSAVRRAARNVPLEVVALAGGDAAREWIDRWRLVRTTIDGRDLLAAGVPAGPAIGAGLDAALDARLDGELDPALPEPEAELAVALPAARRVAAEGC